MNNNDALIKAIEHCDKRIRWKDSQGESATDYDSMRGFLLSLQSQQGVGKPKRCYAVDVMKEDEKMCIYPACHCHLDIPFTESQQGVSAPLKDEEGKKMIFIQLCSAIDQVEAVKYMKSEAAIETAISLAIERIRYVRDNLQSSAPLKEQDKTNWRGKVLFYREQTQKLRDYIEDNNIGRPNQGFADAILEHFQSLTKEDKPKIKVYERNKRSFIGKKSSKIS